MNIALWIAAGAALGWIMISFFGFNRGRGKLVSILIGAFGGLLGGATLAPIFAAPSAVPGEFSMAAIGLAALCAAMFLAIANLVEKR